MCTTKGLSSFGEGFYGGWTNHSVMIKERYDVFVSFPDLTLKEGKGLVRRRFDSVKRSPTKIMLG